MDSTNTPPGVETPSAIVKQNTNHNLATGKPADQPFRFFDLARELRNAIYASLPVRVLNVYRAENNRTTSETEIAPFCLPKLRLVDHQFKEEYEEEVLKKSKATIKVSLHEGMNVCTIAPPDTANLLSKVQHVTVFFWVGHDSPFSMQSSMLAPSPANGLVLNAEGQLAAATIVEREASKVVALMPALRSLKLEMHLMMAVLSGSKKIHATLALPDHDDDLDLRRVLTSHFLERGSAGMTVSDAVQVERVLLVTNDQISIGRETLQTEPYLDFWLNIHSTDYKITYRARPTRDPQSWYGYELTTESAKLLDIDDLIHEYKSKHEKKYLQGVDADLDLQANPGFNADLDLDADLESHVDLELDADLVPDADGYIAYPKRDAYLFGMMNRDSEPYQASDPDVEGHIPSHIKLEMQKWNGKCFVAVDSAKSRAR